MIKNERNIHQDASLLGKAMLEDAEGDGKNSVEALLKEHPELQDTYRNLQGSRILQESFARYRTYEWEKAYQKFLRETGDMEMAAGKKKISFRRLWQYAAIAILLLTVCAGIYVMNSEPEAELPVQGASGGQTVIAPGSRQGLLTLTDGSVVDVNKKNVDWTVDGVHVKYKGGVLSYDQKESAVQHKVSREVASNELTIPRGGENTVELSDGTVIHLNAGSKLIYPVRFGGKNRRVRLEGEAYFEVAKDENHPFVVQTRMGDITVMGTSFNVNVYEKTGKCYTTLVEGKVRFSRDGDHPMALLPGEQLVVSAGEVEKKKVNIDEYIGWVKGEYLFTDRPLHEIMQSFEQWYDIQVEYEKPELRELTYSGSLKRDKSINAFLAALELTGDISYKIDGKKVLIYEKK